MRYLHICGEVAPRPDIMQLSYTLGWLISDSVVVRPLHLREFTSFWIMIDRHVADVVATQSIN